MDIESSAHRILQSDLQTQRAFPLLTPDPTPSNGCVLDAVHRTLSNHRSGPLVLAHPGDGFGKRYVSRPPSASLLTALLTSPKTSCSSPDMSATASDIFTDCEALSSGASSPLSHTPPRKCTFAAAPTEKKKATTATTVQFGKAQQQEQPAGCKFGRLFSRQQHKSGSDQKRARAGDELAPLTKKQLKLDLPSVAQDQEHRHEDEMQREHSVFDSANESDEPKLVNTWLPGEPKKLVDDCLEKDRQNAATYGGDEEDEHIVDEEQDDEEDEEEEEEEDKDDEDEDEDEDDDDEEEATPSTDRIRMRPAMLNVPAANNFLGSEVNTPTCRPAPPSPSFVNDTTDFVPGTLDEDQGVETAYAHSLVVKQQPKRNITPQDIDPTYPDEEDDDDDEDDTDEANNVDKELADPVVGRSPPPRCSTRTPPPIKHGSLQPERSNWGWPKELHSILSSSSSSPPQHHDHNRRQ